MDHNNSRYRQALATVLAHEGGYVDDPDDPGGATNFGVSLRWLRTQSELGDIDDDGDVDGDDIRLITEADAARLYFEKWWQPYGYGEYPDLSVATKAFDLAVNMGPRSAHRVLQRAVRAASSITLADDGVIGPITRKALGECSEPLLLTAMKSEAAGHYRLIAASKPRLKRFLRGWLNRAYS